MRTGWRSAGRWPRRGASLAVFRGVLVAAVLAGEMPVVRAATLLTWDITSTTGATSGSAASALAAGISGSVLDGSTLGTGNSTSPLNTWNRAYQAVTYTTAADALANNQYLSWTTTVDAGYTASFSGITGMNLSRTSNGAQAVELWYSTDGATFSTTGSASAVPGSAATAFSSGMATTPIVLAGGSSGASITWRMVAYSGTGGRLGISRTSTDDFSMLGTITGGLARDLAWVGVGGAGTWDTEPANTPWSAGGSAASFAANDNVAFAVPGNVTVAGSVAAGTITVSHTTGVLTIGGSGFTGTTLSKSGAGDLVLTASNSLTGGAIVNAGRLVVGAAGALGTKSVTLNGGVLATEDAAVTAIANPIVAGSDGATISTAADVSFSGAVTAASGGPGARVVKTGSGALTLTGAFGVQTTAPVELDVTAGTLTLGGSQKNIGGLNDWAAPVALNGAIVMIHGGTVGGGAVVTNRSATSVIASRLNAGAVAFENEIALEQTLTGSSPNSNNTLRFLGPMSGVGGFTAAGNGTKQLWGQNTYTGPTRVVAGTLVLGTRAALYDGTTTNWTSDQFTVQSGATASFRVGGVGQFEASDVDILLGLGSSTGGFLPGSRIGFDTTDGDFAYGGSIADPNGGANSLGLTKSGLNMLTLSGSTSYTGSTQASGGTLLFAARPALYGGNPGSWTAANLVVASGATAAFGVGGADGFTADDIAALSTLGSGTAATGFVSGSRLGIDTSAAGGSFIYDGVLANPDGGTRVLGLAKLGSGTLALTAANTYSGGTTIEEGTLLLANAAALGTVPGPLAVEGGTLDLGGYSITVPAISGSSGTVTNGAATPVALTFNVTSGTATYAGLLADGNGGLSLVKEGAGDLELIGSNSFGGGTLTDGDIRIHQPTSLGSGPVVSTGSAARVYWSGTASAVTLSNPFVTGDDITDALAFAPGTDRALALAGTISGSGQIKISASAGGTLDLSGQTAATNTNTGGVEIGTGRVLIARGENLGGGTVNFGTGTSSILALAGPAASVSNPVTIGSTTGTGAGGAIIDSGSGTLTIAGTIADRPGNLPGSLVKLGSGTLRLSAANTYGGTTTVRQGTLVAANASAIASAPVSVASSATVAIAPYLDATAKELDLSGGGLVDLTTGRLAVAGGLSATQLVAEIVKGRGDGSWNGTSGITSSSAAADMAASIPRAVGWLDNGDGSVSAAFAAPGDTNIDWSIDILDAANFLALGKFDTGAAATWLEGDFSYDGIVDIQDAADFLSTGLFDAGVYNAAPATSDGIAAVPEPSAATFSVLGMLVLLEMRRRRRMLEQEDGPPSPR